MLHQAGSTTLDGASYTYDAAGNRTSKGNYLNGVTSNYGYDPLYELTQVTQGTSTTESYSYDPVGNRLTSVGVPNYIYNSSNELTSNSNGSYTYDANGNTLSDAQGRSFTWDFENRLTQVVNPGVGTTTFRYDPFGRRIQKSGPLGTTNYLYDGPNLIQELDGAGNVLARYTQPEQIDEPLAELRAGAASYYQQDGIDVVTSLSNSAGALANTYTYDAFGKLTASTGTLSNPFQFTGRELDSESGLYYYRSRYYDPNDGRFVSQDPTGLRGGINSYAYVENNPTTFVDPAGLKKTCVPYGDPMPFFWSTTYGPPVPVSGWRYTGYYIEGGAKLGNNVVNCVFQRQVQRQVTHNTYLLQEYVCDDDSAPAGCHPEGFFGFPVPNGRTFETRVVKESESGGVETYTERTTTRTMTIATDSPFWKAYQCLKMGLPPQ